MACKTHNSLWAYLLHLRHPLVCLLFLLVFENAYHLPLELEHLEFLAIKKLNFELSIAREEIKPHLNELEELRHFSYKNAKLYKEKMKCGRI